MSCYTSITKDRIEYQFKTGYDTCERYYIGEAVSWFIDKKVAGTGHLLDGVYPTTTDKESFANWLVIKDHVIVGFAHKRFTEKYLRKKYKITVPRKLWSKVVWKRTQGRRIRLKKRVKRELRRIRKATKDDESVVATILAYPIIRQLNYKSLCRKILKIEDFK